MLLLVRIAVERFSVITLLRRIVAWKKSTKGLPGKSVGEPVTMKKHMIAAMV
jgi:hypothetical protein